MDVYRFSFRVESLSQDLTLERWSAVIIELNGRMVGEVGGLFPWDLPLSKSINRF